MEPQNTTLISTLLLVFSAALGGGLIARLFKLPLLLGYIAGGIIIGNLLLHSLDTALLSMISDTGVTLLLFTLGVEFSFHRLKTILLSVAWPATVQIVLTAVIFYLLLSLFGFPHLPSLFIAAAISLSSTAVIIKFLSERGELESNHGDLVTGWLVVQDLAVIPMMILLPSLSLLSIQGSVPLFSVFGSIILSFLKAGVVVCTVILFGRNVVPKLLNASARLKNRELFLIITIGIVFMSSIFSYSLGLSAALGAFIAGLLVAETSQNHAIFAEIRPLRDIFVVVFFVSLGLVLPFSTLISQLPLLLVTSSLVILVKWILVFILSRTMGYHRKTSFLAGLYLIPMSEFGFIITKEGLNINALSHDTFVFIVSLTLLTLFIDTVLSNKSHALYQWFNKTFGAFLPKLFPTHPDHIPLSEELPFENHIVICGYGRVGKYIGRALEMANISYLVVDYNHTTVKTLRDKGVKVVYGDPADKDVLDYAQVDKAKAIVIAIPDRHTQELVISNAHSLNRRIRIICRTHHEEDQSRLKSLGVAIVVQPEFEAALSIVERLLPEFGVSEDDMRGKVSRLKIEHGLG